MVGCTREGSKTNAKVSERRNNNLALVSRVVQETSSGNCPQSLYILLECLADTQLASDERFVCIHKLHCSVWAEQA